MNWQEACLHPHLRNLPFKVELNEYGKVVMSPVKVAHSALQGEIEFLLRSRLRGGKTLPECAIATDKGTKVADVAWVSDARFQLIREETECSIAPEICIEVVSASHSRKELAEKRRLYIRYGAEEVWVCRENGSVQFFDKEGKLEKSRLVADFPSRIIL